MSKDDNYYLQHPMLQKFYRNLAFVLTITAVGDQRLLGYGRPSRLALLQKRVVQFFVMPVVVSQFVYLYINWRSMTIQTMTCIFCIIPAASVDFIYANISPNMKIYKMVQQGFLGNAHLYNYKSKVNEDIHIDKTLLKMEKNIRAAACLLLFVYLSSWGALILAPIYMNISNKEEILNKTLQLQSVIYFVQPFEYNYNVQNWIIQHVINSYLIFVGCLILVIGNILKCINILNVIGHLQVLKQEINSFVRSPEVGKDKDNLTKIIKHHAFIMKIFEEIQSAFGLNVTGSYCHNLFVDSILLFSIMLGEKHTKPMYISMLVTIIGELIQMSYVLEEIKKQTDNLSDKIYFMPWEDLSLSDQKTFLLLLMRAQPPLEFIAAGGLRAGWKPTIAIIKSALSYYVMLKTTMEYKTST